MGFGFRRLGFGGGGFSFFKKAMFDIYFPSYLYLFFVFFELGRSCLRRNPKNLGLYFLQF
jgi:hypothetical protein